MTNLVAPTQTELRTGVRGGLATAADAFDRRVAKLSAQPKPPMIAEAFSEPERRAEFEKAKNALGSEGMARAAMCMRVPR